jgi:hypothetical protein
VKGVKKCGNYKKQELQKAAVVFEKPIGETVWTRQNSYVS